MLKRLLCGCVVFGLLLCLCACGTDADATLVGQWNCQINLRETVSQMVGGLVELDDSLEPVTVVVDIVFREDGSYSLTYDQDHISQQIDLFVDSAWDSVVKQLADKASLPIEEIEKAIQEKGLTKDILKENLDLAGIFSVFTKLEGCWKLEGNMLYLGSSVEELEHATPIEISLTADKFSIVSVDDILIPGISRAVVFYRAEGIK